MRCRQHDRRADRQQQQQAGRTRHCQRPQPRVRTAPGRRGGALRPVALIAEGRLVFMLDLQYNLPLLLQERPRLLPHGTRRGRLLPLPLLVALFSG